MRLPTAQVALWVLWTTLAHANVEKTIFVAPPYIPIPQVHPNLDTLRLDTLSPAHGSLRTHLAAAFPTEALPKGNETWVLLEGLKPGRRYEVRVCWAATQPTKFWLEPYTMETVFETPALITSLAIYSESRQTQETPSEKSSQSATTGAHNRVGQEVVENLSLLFLQISAAADYFTTNETLMQNVPPVHVDIILDPYLWNVLPQSLLPTALYIVILALGSIWLSSRIWAYFQRLGETARYELAAQAPEEESTEKKGL